MAVTVLTKENFEIEAVKSDKPVLIDFWAPWCGPCKMLSPIVDEIAEEQDAVKVCKVNVDDEGELAQQFGVMSIPTLILMVNGEVKSTSVGYKPKKDVLKIIG
jgi:thioredoxin 1